MDEKRPLTNEAPEGMELVWKVPARPGAFFNPGMAEKRLPVGRRYGRIVIEFPKAVTREEWDRLTEAIWAEVIVPLRAGDAVQDGLGRAARAASAGPLTQVEQE